MVYTAAFRNMPPAQRADLLYQQAKDDMSLSLWKAAIGAEPAGDGKSPAPGRRTAEMDLTTLLTLLTQPDAQAHSSAAVPPPRAEPQGAPVMPTNPGGHDESDGQSPRGTATGLGPNETYRDALSGAATRTGLPAEALAAIINAEAAQSSDGRWISHSRNPRSSATGLGQFLSGTWKGMAERPGSWLNGLAWSRGWLDAHGHVRGDAKSDLLALRNDPRASIETIADYARDNVASMKAAGIEIGGDSVRIARAAYFAHYMGTGDAIRFLKRGLDADRAEYLLTAQIGSTAANQRIAACGDAAEAHRAWLMGHMARQFRPGRFTSAFA